MSRMDRMSEGYVIIDENDRLVANVVYEDYDDAVRQRDRESNSIYLKGCNPRSGLKIVRLRVEEGDPYKEYRQACETAFSNASRFAHLMGMRMKINQGPEDWESGRMTQPEIMLTATPGDGTTVVYSFRMVDGDTVMTTPAVSAAPYRGGQRQSSEILRLGSTAEERTVDRALMAIAADFTNRIIESIRKRPLE